jgi:hypothetical protein
VICSNLGADSGNTLLTTTQRREIESQLKNYDIPMQILQMVASENNCNIDILTKNGKAIRRSNLELFLPKMDDKSIITLQQIFLDCQDVFSHFRFAVFLSSKFSSLQYKFIVNENVMGVSGDKHFLEVCIYGRESGLLVAVGGQNNNPDSRPASNESIQAFLTAVKALYLEHPSLRGAYYASSYGYSANIRSMNNLWDKTQAIGQDSSRAMEIKFFEYKDKVYFEYEP